MEFSKKISKILLTFNIIKFTFRFFPIKQNIEVNGSPVSGVTFSQLRATLSGEVKCLPDSSTNCKSIEVTLHSLDSMGKLTGQTVSAVAESKRIMNKKCRASSILVLFTL